jgi:hypothetical protein
MATVESTIVRTFYQKGLGFLVSDGTPGSIDVHIDGKLIYSGNIPGVSSSPPGYDTTFDTSLFQYLFNWPVDIDFMGPVAISIQAADCVLHLANTQSNYVDPNGDHEKIGNLGYIQIVDGVSCLDPFTNVHINGVPMTRGIEPPTTDGTTAPLSGQWFWEIGPDSIFEATLNIEPGWL